MDRIPLAAEFEAIPFYDRTSPALIGTPYYMGCDEHGNKVYFMGMYNQRSGISASLISLLDVAGVDPEGYIFQDTFPLINFSTKIGGLLSNKYNLKTIGRRLTIWGLQRRYYSFTRLVYLLKQRLAE